MAHVIDLIILTIRDDRYGNTNYRYNCGSMADTLIDALTDRTIAAFDVTSEKPLAMSYDVWVELLESSVRTKVREMLPQLLADFMEIGLDVLAAACKRDNNDFDVDWQKRVDEVVDTCHGSAG